MTDDVQVILIICMVFAFLTMARGFGFSRGQRRLRDEIAALRTAQVTAPPAAALPGATREQVARLEERVRVLERIVTDRGSSLAAEIEALREKEESAQ